tara:strand:- start:1207 stop:1419 length:213 start_codon:yes stop_codon:yes gene_type:complete
MTILTTICLCTLLACALGACQQGSIAELDVGVQAPNFKLAGTDGKTYELKDFRGKQVVVIAWFPKAFTGG